MPSGVWIGVAKEKRRFGGLRVDGVKVASTLRTRRLLDDRAGTSLKPFHSREIELVFVFKIDEFQRNFRRFVAEFRKGRNSDLRRRVFATDARILERDHRRIRRKSFFQNLLRIPFFRVVRRGVAVGLRRFRGVVVERSEVAVDLHDAGRAGDAGKSDAVEHYERRFARRVEPPKRDFLAVRRPTETVAAVKFLFVNPVERSVNNIGAPVEGDAANLSAQNFFDVNIVFTNISDARSVRRNLRELERRRRREIPAELAQDVVFAVENPIIAARVASPNALRFRINQNEIRVVGKRVILDVQGCCAFDRFVRLGVARNQFRRFYDRRRRPVARREEDDVAPAARFARRDATHKRRAGRRPFRVDAPFAKLAGRENSLHRQKRAFRFRAVRLLRNVLRENALRYRRSSKIALENARAQRRRDDETTADDAL